MNRVIETVLAGFTAIGVCACFEASSMQGGGVWYSTQTYVQAAVAPQVVVSVATVGEPNVANASFPDWMWTDGAWRWTSPAVATVPIYSPAMAWETGKVIAIDRMVEQQPLVVAGPPSDEPSIQTVVVTEPAASIAEPEVTMTVTPLRSRVSQP